MILPLAFIFQRQVIFVKLNFCSQNVVQDDIDYCRFMVFNAAFNNISVLLMEETRVPVDNHRPMYLIQHHVIKFVSDLWLVCGFLQVLWFSPPIKRLA